MGPADGAISVGKIIQFQATANIVAAGWEWSSRNPVVAVVGAGGVVQGVTPGTAKIQACVANAPSFCGLADITVVAAAPTGAAEVAVAPGSMTIDVGQTLEYMATAINFSPPSWLWFSIDPLTATIGADGRLTGRRPGMAVVAACAPTAPKYCGTATVQVR